MNYDVVIGVGCSFMNGDRILNNSGKCIGKQFVSGLVLSEKLKCDYVHMGRTGSSNERMFKNIYEWVENNNETGHYEKPLFIIGLSGTIGKPFLNCIVSPLTGGESFLKLVI